MSATGASARRAAARGGRPRRLALFLALALSAGAPAAGCAGDADTHGFMATAPAGWEDATEVVELRTRDDFEAAYRGPGDATLYVVRAEPPAGSDLADVVRDARRVFAHRAYTRGGRRDPARLGPDERTTLDGDAAVAFDVAQGGRRGRQVHTLRDGHAYVITFGAPRPDFGVLDAYLRSWRWQR